MSTDWRKATASNPNGECVEVSRLPSGRVGVRDSKDPDGPVLVFTAVEFDRFRAGMKTGEFDDI